MIKVQDSLGATPRGAFKLAEPAKKKKRRYDSMANPPPRGALKHKPAAFYLSVSAPTLHRIVKKGLIRPNRATRHLLYDIRELDRFLKAGQY